MALQNPDILVAKVFLRVDFDPHGRIGPGKIRLLELIDETGSISAAGRRLDMSYRHAWILVEELNRCFREPVVTTHTGGRSGGGAVVTRFGHALIWHYRTMEARAGAAIGDLLAVLDAATPDTVVPVTPADVAEGHPDPGTSADPDQCRTPLVPGCGDRT